MDNRSFDFRQYKPSHAKGGNLLPRAKGSIYYELDLCKGEHSLHSCKAPFHARVER